MKNQPLHELLEQRLGDGRHSSLRNCLFCAAEWFDENAKALEDDPQWKRLAAQFRRQAADARELMAELCDGPDDEAAAA